MDKPVGHTKHDRDILQWLPSIFWEPEAKEPVGPVRAILSVFEEAVAEIEQKAEADHGSLYLDPMLPRLTEDERAEEDQWLNWLASWVSLPVDHDWTIAQSAQAGDESGVVSGGSAETTGLRRKRHLIRNAAHLHQLRGTVDGLKLMLESFYGVKVDIVEWAWPQGMEIETASMIGVDTVILDPPDIDRAFTVVLDASDFDLHEVDAPGFWMETILLGPAQEVRVWIPVLGRGVAKENQKPHRLLEKILQVLAWEKPAHTEHYIAFRTEKPETREQERLLPLVIEVRSTIGMFLIDAECEP